MYTFPFLCRIIHDKFPSFNRKLFQTFYMCLQRHLDADRKKQNLKWFTSSENAQTVCCLCCLYFDSNTIFWISTCYAKNPVN